mmetsp:Transcript_90248/g.258245  ORF Transcript_90248/g.258245 Transcript_90248/m.258245 type:complete len:245 (-) Transcript_90248:9-743(-)
MFVKHGRELGDSLRIRALVNLAQEDAVGGCELDQAAARGGLHLEGRLLAAQNEGDQADRTGHVVVGELHEVPTADRLGAKASEDHLQHPQPQLPRGTRLHPLVSLNAREEHVVHLVHMLQQLHKQVLAFQPRQHVAHLRKSLEGDLVHIEGIRSTTGDDHGLDVVEDQPEALEGDRVDAARARGRGDGMPPLQKLWLRELRMAAPARGDAGEPLERVRHVLHGVANVRHGSGSPLLLRAACLWQ